MKIVSSLSSGFTIELGEPEAVLMLILAESEVWVPSKDPVWVDELSDVLTILTTLAACGLVNVEDKLYSLTALGIRVMDKVIGVNG